MPTMSANIIVSRYSLQHWRSDQFESGLISDWILHYLPILCFAAEWSSTISVYIKSSLHRHLTHEKYLFIHPGYEVKR